jgi:acetyl-CoA synthetase
VAFVTSAHADAVEAIKDKCPTLEHLVLIRMNRKGWHSFDTLCAQSDDHFDRAMVGPTGSKDLISIYFKSGSTAMPKLVGRN